MVPIVVTRHPLQVVIWQHEEGGLVGSHAAVGDTLDLERQFNGIRLGDGLRKIGGHPDRLAEARMAPGSFHCYIEQGGNLDRAGIPIGVVEGIVSIDEYDVDGRTIAGVLKAKGGPTAETYPRTGLVWLLPSTS